ncbi:RagB/SusD family nutrient uptake outer membrane protein [Bacteroides oleiciplenus]|uniref:RagB/SusD domain-containing protein n=1 Tax=Bacteroides oleiciplenus YIT 12058 TaxID=742727 RepID=K9EKD1_9BACE|nr:RagB/SusD family nutrient uptake outer membrane protein [Bacteroides oleiciplenus]EKU89615.1 hypothetical protein HMPREF9447_03053 [Bacteroides oleiciplenus YIT 12058]
MKKNIIYIASLVLLLTCILTSCDDYLDREPLSSISPEGYFKNADQLLAYTNEIYSRVMPDNGGNSYGLYESDQGTDNQIKSDAVPSKYDDGVWKVGQSGGGWSFETIYRCNYFFSMVNPKFGEQLDGSENTIQGDLSSIRHYIGEMYTLRALTYFNIYQSFGDFPIITEPLNDNLLVLTEASKRSPRNEVARFILSDLDKAIEFLSSKDLETTRINRDVALLIKSRVALYEGSWLKNFKGTAFVPNGEGWPGKQKDYNANYQFPSGNIDNEINWFLEQAVSASKEVAEKYKGSLTKNTGVFPQNTSEPNNPYYDMYISVDLSSYKEVMLWRRYAPALKMHGIPIAANTGNNATGVSRSYVQNFLMADGKPVYAHGTYADGDGYYMGDKSLANVRVNRDTRLSVFLQEPGQDNMINGTTGSNIYYIVPFPDILGLGQYRYPTGYVLRKALSTDIAMYLKGNEAYTAVPVYRAVEALLNYMEASYELTGRLDETAREYWKIIRQRAHVSDDIDGTIAATDMSQEANNDWAAYTAGKLIDPVLYNIRRERRCEFIAEGLRYMDLCRWRAMDQLMIKPYIPEGIHFWNTPMQQEVDASKIVCDGSTQSNLSSSESSEYIRPFQKNSSQRCYNGFIWHMAHYLEPIAVKHFLITSSDGVSVEDSPIYQNPYWPTVPNMPAEK